MKERGIGTAVIIVVVVIIAAVVGVGGYLLLKGGGEEKGPGGLQLYPGSRSDIPEEYRSALEDLKDNHLLLPQGVEIAEYIVSGDVFYWTGLDWYENHMGDWKHGRGWGCNYSNLTAKIGDLKDWSADLYVKDSLVAGIWVAKVQGMDDTIYVLATGSISEFQAFCSRWHIDLTS